MRTKQNQNTSLFIIGVTLFVLLIYCYTRNIIFLWTGILFLVIPVISLKLARLIFLPLMNGFEYLGLINSKFILMIFFLVFLTPIAWLKKLISNEKKDTLDKFKSTLIEHKYEYSKEDFLKQW